MPLCIGGRIAPYSQLAAGHGGAVGPIAIQPTFILLKLNDALHEGFAIIGAVRSNCGHEPTEMLWVASSPSTLLRGRSIRVLHGMRVSCRPHEECIVRPSMSSSRHSMQAFPRPTASSVGGTRSGRKRFPFVPAPLALISSGDFDQTLGPRRNACSPGCRRCPRRIGRGEPAGWRSSSRTWGHWHLPTGLATILSWTQTPRRYSKRL